MEKEQWLDYSVFRQVIEESTHIQFLKEIQNETQPEKETQALIDHIESVFTKYIMNIRSEKEQTPFLYTQCTSILAVTSAILYCVASTFILQIALNDISDLYNALKQDPYSSRIWSSKEECYQSLKIIKEQLLTIHPLAYFLKHHEKNMNILKVLYAVYPLKKSENSEARQIAIHINPYIPQPIFEKIQYVLEAFLPQISHYCMFSQKFMDELSEKPIQIQDFIYPKETEPFTEVNAQMKIMFESYDKLNSMYLGEKDQVYARREIKKVEGISPVEFASETSSHLFADTDINVKRTVVRKGEKSYYSSVLPQITLDSPISAFLPNGTIDRCADSLQYSIDEQVDSTKHTLSYGFHFLPFYRRINLHNRILSLADGYTPRCFKAKFIEIYILRQNTPIPFSSLRTTYIKDELSYSNIFFNLYGYCNNTVNAFPILELSSDRQTPMELHPSSALFRNDDYISSNVAIEYLSQWKILDALIQKIKIGYMHCIRMCIQRIHQLSYLYFQKECEQEHIEFVLNSFFRVQNVHKIYEQLYNDSKTLLKRIDDRTILYQLSDHMLAFLLYVETQDNPSLFSTENPIVQGIRVFLTNTFCKTESLIALQIQPYTAIEDLVPYFLLPYLTKDNDYIYGNSVDVNRSIIVGKQRKLYSVSGDRVVGLELMKRTPYPIYIESPVMREYKQINDFSFISNTKSSAEKRSKNRTYKKKRV